MRRRLAEPAESPRAASGSGLASLTLPVIARPAGLLVDERSFEEHRRTQEPRLSGQCWLTFTPDHPVGAGHQWGPAITPALFG